MSLKNTLSKFLPVALVATFAVTGCAAQDAGDETSSESDLTNCFFGFGPSVHGAIEAKYVSLGACLSFLGPPVHEERVTPDGKGRFMGFANGSIYWRHDLGAFVVRGEIRELWKAFGWEGGDLGYPLSDETLTPDGRGRFNVFEGGSIYWTMQTGAHEVRGAIRDKYKELGWEEGPLGYPVSGEQILQDGVRTYFERGNITWTRSTGRISVVMPGNNR